MGALLSLIIIVGVIVVVIKNPSLIWIALGIGALILFAPIVLPIIGIIISFIVGSIGFALSLIFGLGAAVVAFLPIALVIGLFVFIYLALFK